MPLEITFELDDEDLAHFRDMMGAARKAAQGRDPAAIVEAAQGLLDRRDTSEVPRFARERMDKLGDLINMVLDEDWALPEDERSRVLDVLAYFSEPLDLIADHVPGLGFLDDAIMIELVAQELHPEIEAYQDFCRFRAEEDERRRAENEEPTQVTREQWLEARRTELHSRARRRRKRRAEAAGLFSLFSLR